MPLPLFAARHHFDPRSIPGLEGWWDAADAASVTLDSGRVSEWRDKSGNGRHAANSTSGSTQPDYVEGGRNGLSVLRFTAASTQRLTIASSTAAFNFLHNGTASCVMSVAKYGDSADPQALYFLFGNAGASVSNRGVYVGYDDRNTAGNADMFNATITSGGTFVANAFNAANNAALADYANTLTPNTYLVQDIVLHGSASAAQRLRLRVNGGAEKAANNKTGTASASNATFDMQFGAAGNNALPLLGDICELLFFSELPTELARDGLRRYLGAKWGISVA